ncbi:MAG: acetate uptake transporter [Methanoregula sp.]|nr:acetate uptake transporter [Methanoregula sp.]
MRGHISRTRDETGISGIAEQSGLAIVPSPLDLAAFLAVWGTLIVGLFICSLKIHRILQVTLEAVVLLVVLLVAANPTRIHRAYILAGITGIITGGLAIYRGIGAVINDVYGSRVVPVGFPVFSRNRT